MVAFAIKGREVQFTLTPAEAKTVNRISTRAQTKFRGLDVIGLQMDLAAVHSNGCPLRLASLLTFSDMDFVHDIIGIGRHINRRTGQLEGAFIPRCATFQ
jgi:hypothetical protein